MLSDQSTKTINKLSSLNDCIFNNMATSTVGQNTSKKSTADSAYISKNYICNVTPNSTNNNNAIDFPIHNNIACFGGERIKSISQWLRQFKNFSRLYKGFTHSNVHLFASSFLRGDAAKFYDELDREPVDYEEFIM